MLQILQERQEMSVNAEDQHDVNENETKVQRSMVSDEFAERLDSEIDYFFLCDDLIEILHAWVDHTGVHRQHALLQQDVRHV